MLYSETASISMAMDQITLRKMRDAFDCIRFLRIRGVEVLLLRSDCLVYANQMALLLTEIIATEPAGTVWFVPYTERIMNAASRWEDVGRSALMVKHLGQGRVEVCTRTGSETPSEIVETSVCANAA